MYLIKDSDNPKSRTRTSPDPNLTFAPWLHHYTFKKKKNSKGYFFSQKRVEQNEQKVGGAELEDRKLSYSLYTRVEAMASKIDRN